MKGSCTEMMILRSCLQYDSDHAFWKIPSVESTSLKADILKLCPKGNVFEEHENFIKTFDIKLRTDERIIMIMCAITLFSPDHANIVHKDVITLEQVCVCVCMVCVSVKFTLSIIFVINTIYRTLIIFCCGVIWRAFLTDAKLGRYFYNY
jgi:hypothetical protein